MENTKIEWADHTVNFWHGCQKVSPACDNCYAEEMSNRFNPGLWGKNSNRKMRVDKAINECKALNRKAKKKGVVERVFINSMSDFFEDRADLHEARTVACDTFYECKNLVFMLLTKRPEMALQWFGGDSGAGLDVLKHELSNVWIGITVENQKMAHKRIQELLQIPATVRFLSCEPMLGSISLSWLAAWPGQKYSGMHPHHNFKGTHQLDGLRELQWIICGGESGHKARPMNPEWARTLRDQCKEAGVSFFFKQWGEWVPCGMVEDETKYKTEIIDGAIMCKVGKKEAGRLLDGLEYNQIPI